MAEFFQMGGYAFFVWTSYAIVFLAFVYAFISPLIKHKKLMRELSELTHPRKQSKVVATLSAAQTESASAE